MDSFSYLPYEVQEKILMLLPPRSLFNICQLNSDWFSYFDSEECNFLWRSMCNNIATKHWSKNNHLIVLGR